MLQARLTKYGAEAREALWQGVNAVATAVITTLGPKGRNVAIGQPWGPPDVVHDGVTVARNMEVEDPFESVGVNMVKEASSRTNDIAGDGTTTSMVLAKAIIEEGLKVVTAGANPMFLRRGIEKAVNFAEARLRELANPVDKPEDIQNVATISAGSSEIGKHVAYAIEKVGREGTVTTEQSGGNETIVEVKEGMEFKGGYASPFFVTDPQRMEAEVKEAKVLVTDLKLTSPNEIVPFLQGFVKHDKNLVVIAPDIEGGALAVLATNKIKRIVDAVAIKAPFAGEKQKEFLLDVAALTGAQLVSQDAGLTLETVGMEHLGKATKVIASRNTTIIVAEDSEARRQRVTQLKSELDKEKIAIQKERLEERIAKLTGSIAVVDVGAPTESELKEKVERVKDAIGATKAALAEGIVPGGGVALVKVAKDLEKYIEATEFKKEEREVKEGMEIVARALYMPMWWIANNSGAKPDWVVSQVKDKLDQEPNVGFSVETGTLEDMLAIGVIDPVKVTRLALINASSVATMLLTTEAVIVEKPKEIKEQE